MKPSDKHSPDPARRSSGARPCALATRALLAPLMWLGRCRLSLVRRVTRLLAVPLRLVMRRRVRVVRRNLELCFPELAPQERAEIEQAHFRQLAEAVGEISYAWNHRGPVDDAVGRVQGLEHYTAAHAQGGVLLLTAHVTCLELAARILGGSVQGCGLYRPLRNVALEVAQQRGRQRYADGMFARDDLRGIVRHLRSGGVLWYAPDQDLGPERCEFAPWFGIETATARAIVDLARLGRARVVPMYPLKDPVSGRVTVHLEAAFEDFPSADPIADLARYNAFLERWVRAHPAQYWWLHRRFKTRPEGQPDRYRN